jgi:hypothetical protein
MVFIRMSSLYNIPNLIPSVRKMSPFLDEYKVTGRVDGWEHRRTETGAYFVAVGEEEV